MILGALLDENLKDWWHESIVEVHAHLVVKKIGLADCLPKRTPDPILLAYCEANQFALITDNRTSMPRHLEDFKLAGRRMPGIFNVDPDADIKFVTKVIELLIGAGHPWEFCNQIRYLSEFY